jgi:hypothetical protein
MIKMQSSTDNLNDLINLKIDLPPDIIKKLENVIIETVTKTLQEHVGNIKAEPKMYTWKEAASTLRVTTSHSKRIRSSGQVNSKESRQKGAL